VVALAAAAPLDDTVMTIVLRFAAAIFAPRFPDLKNRAAGDSETGSHAAVTSRR